MGELPSIFYGSQIMEKGSFKGEKHLDCRPRGHTDLKKQPFPSIQSHSKYLLSIYKVSDMVPTAVQSEMER